LERSITAIRRSFAEIEKELPRGYIADLEKYGFFDDGLTVAGVKYLKDIADKFRDR